MPDYSQAKIYKVVCSETNKIYIGSTIQPLYKRLYQHKHKGTSNHSKTKEFIKPKIFLIEDFPCERKEQLEARERFYIEKNNCVNKNIPLRTRQEWRECNKDILSKKNIEYKKKNKQKIQEYNKKYNIENKELINQKRNEKISCECGKKITKRNKARHYKSNKHIKFLEDLKIKEIA